MKELYFGYRHVNGNLIIKRYFDKYDLSVCLNSPFVYRTYGPVEAMDSLEAEQIIKILVRHT